MGRLTTKPFYNFAIIHEIAKNTGLAKVHSPEQFFAMWETVLNNELVHEIITIITVKPSEKTQ